MKAIISQSVKNVMQSGRGKSDLWTLEYDEPVNRAPESLNGWTSADSTLAQVLLKFPSLDKAEQYARDKGIDYTVKPASTRKIRPRNYSDNFKYIPTEDE